LVADSAGRARFWLVCLVGAALPLFAFPALTLAGRPIDAATIFATLFVLAAAPAVARARERPLLTWAACAAAAPLLVFLTAASRAATFEPRQFALTYAHWLLMVAFFVCAGHLDLDRREWNAFVVVQIAGGLAVAVFCFYQLLGRPLGWPATGYLISVTQRLPFAGGTFGSYERPTSFLLEPSYMGSYLVWVAVLPLSIALERVDSARARRALHGAIFLFLAAAILASASLGAYLDLAVVVGLSLVFAARRSRGRRRLGKVLLFFASAALIALAVDALLGHGPWRALVARVDSSASAVAAGRYEDVDTYRGGVLWRELRVAAEHPLAGVGLGQYKVMSATIPLAVKGSGEVVFGWISAVAEMGLPGLGVLVAALVAARRRSAVLVGALLIAYLIVNQLHFASYVELTFWYPLAACALASRQSGSDRLEG
jgi:hypothetical protein